MEKETKKSVVEQAAVALRLWSNAWREFDKTGKNKPETFEEVIKPFIEMEKEQHQETFKQSRSAKIFEKDMPPVWESFEQYYKQTFKSE